MPVDEELWAQVVRHWPRVARPAPTLLHDDYHPGNVLWSRGRLTSIVDWTGAGFGQPASDVCYLRQDVSLVSGLDAGDEVLAAYEAASGGPVPDRPFWELLAATRAKGAEEWWWGSYVDFGLPVTLAQVRTRLDQLIARALADWADAVTLVGASRRSGGYRPLHPAGVAQRLEPQPSKLVVRVRFPSPAPAAAQPACGGPPARFERATVGIEVRCSVQLSYGGSREAYVSSPSHLVPVGGSTEGTAYADRSHGGRSSGG